MQKGICAALAASILSLPLPAWAVLGGKAGNVPADQAKIQTAIRASVQTSPYSVQTRQTPSGITIREYADSQGNIFAVSWQGPFMPNLKQLLGQYFSTYITATHRHRGGLHHRTVTEPNLVVHSQGHMRAFSGIAYLPAMLPPGVKPTDLQ